jgi:hypothetical protein
MFRKVLFSLAFLAALTTAQSVYPQTRPAQPQVKEPAKEMKAGEVAKLGESLTVKVMRASKASFPGVKVKGEPVVVILELDGGKKSVTLSYQVDSNPRRSDVYIDSRATRFSPIAFIEDFPSWGNDNDKEIEIVDPKDPSSSTLDFEGKGSVVLLFDLPATQAKSLIKLSASLRLSGPKDEQHSIVVLL